MFPHLIAEIPIQPRFTEAILGLQHFQDFLPGHLHADEHRGIDIIKCEAVSSNSRVTNSTVTIRGVVPGRFHLHSWSHPKKAIRAIPV